MHPSTLKGAHILSLFHTVQGDDTGPALYCEPEFGYLNRSARQGVQNIRDMLDGWFARYPEQHRPDLGARFRSSNNVDHRSAFFELFLHELVLRLGCTAEVHPNVASSARHPDFLVSAPNGHRSYLEAVLATDETREEAAAMARMNIVYDALNRLESPDFFVGMDMRGAPETPPPARQIRAYLGERLAAVDYAALSQAFEQGGFRALPHWPYRHDGWNIEFFPVPKSPNLRGRPGVRPLAIHFEGVKQIDSRTAIRNAIVEKAKAYGDLELPYVVAVNALGDFVDRIAVMEALFGQEQFVYRATLEGPCGPEFERVADGAWTSPQGPRYTRVSAALVAIQVRPSNIPWTPVCLYHNPWARRPYDSSLNRLSRAVPRDETHMNFIDGELLSAIFALPQGWPRE